MEIPDYVAEKLAEYAADHPEITHAAVSTDNLGGWFIDYAKSKEQAERFSAGQVNTEVVAFVDEEVLCLTTMMQER